MKEWLVAMQRAGKSNKEGAGVIEWPLQSGVWGLMRRKADLL